MDATNYPLTWPLSQPRTPKSKIERARFRSGKNGSGSALSVYEAVKRLFHELKLLGVPDYDVIISTNMPTRQYDGLPRSNIAEPNDRGAAVYFKLDGQPHVLACDKWDRVADNIAAIAAHVDAARGQERWGVGTLKQAFAGYKALPAAEAVKPWWIILGFKDPPERFDTVKDKHRDLSLKHHPDRGGNMNQMAEINAALSDAEKFYKK